jgi:predicted phosphate transport protein (TIGR00153 family)
MRFRLVPTDDRFLTMFTESATNAADCARRLRDLVGRLPETTAAAHEQVVACERKGDELTRAILHRLNSTFVTPFDREDIHALAEELDDVVDDMLAVSAVLIVVQVGGVLPELGQQAELLVQMADEAVGLLGRLGDMKGIEPHLDAIDRLETEGDRVYRSAQARLFSGEYDALEVLKWKDVIQAMEAALNTVEDISNVVESIVLKHA